MNPTAYLALYTRTADGFAAVVPELDTVLANGATLDELKQLLAEGIALHLHEEPGSPAPRARMAAELPAEALAPYDAPPLELLVEPAPLNPISLEIERLMDASGLSMREIGRRMKTSHAALHRLADPFYWGHSLSTLRTLGEVLGVEPVVTFRELQTA